MIKIEGNQIYSTDKYLHRKGDDNAYFKRCILLEGDTEDTFEEVDEIPNLNINE